MNRGKYTSIAIVQILTFHIDTVIQFQLDFLAFFFHSETIKSSKPRLSCDHQPRPLNLSTPFAWNNMVLV